jgi:hypothetical protein
MRAKLLCRQAEVSRDSSFQGIPVTIEWPKGSTREGTNKEGKPWKRKMLCDYGSIPDTKAAGDNENLDIYIGPDSDSPTAWVIEQLKDDGSFDEPKCMLGFDTEDEARDMYLKHYPEGWESHIGDVRPIDVTRLAEMVDAEQTAVEQRTMEQADHMAGRKTARFLRKDELRKIFREQVLPNPLFQAALREIGHGKTWDELTSHEQHQVCALEQDRRLGLGEV